MQRAGKQAEAIRKASERSDRIGHFKDDKVSLRNKEAELQSAVEIRDTASLREALEIRARAFHMLSVADYFVMRRLTEKYISMLRQTVIEGMRGPTMNEVRRTDRVPFRGDPEVGFERTGYCRRRG